MHRKLDIYFLYFYLIIFKTFGLVPFSMRVNKRGDKMKVEFIPSTAGRIYNVFLLFILFFPNYILLHSRLHDSKFTQVGLAFSFSIILSADVCLKFILISHCYQDRIILIANRLINLKYNLAECLHQLPSIESRKYIDVLIIFTHILMYISYLIVFTAFAAQTAMKYSLSFTVFLLGWFMIEYSLMMKYIEYQCRVLNASLLVLGNYNKKMAWNSLNWVMNETQSFQIRRDLIAIRNARRILYEISVDVSKLNEWQILFIAVYACLQLIYNTYLVVSYWIFSKESKNSMKSLFNTLLFTKDIFPLIILTTYGNKVITETNRTAKIVHEVMATDFNDAASIKYELQQFSMELVHQSEISFAACGYFSINGQLLKSIMSAVITYVIILLQQNSTQALIDG